MLKLQSLTHERVFTCVRSIVLSLLFAGAAFTQNIRDDTAIIVTSEDLREIQHEQSELRHELLGLEQATRRIQRRLEQLDRIAAVQKELDRLVHQLAQAESSDNEKLTEQVESKISAVEHRIDDLREALEAHGELHERIDEIKEVTNRLREIEGIEEATRWSRYLEKTVDRLKQLRELHGEFHSLSPKAANPIRDKLEQQLDALQEQIDADKELVEQISHFFEALENDRDEAIEELAPEISKLQNELEGRRGVSVKTERPKAPEDGQSRLKSGKYFLTQTWSQERNFKRPYYVSVPNPQQPDSSSKQRKMPVLIFLHGNGGNAQEAMRGIMRHRKRIAARYIMVFPQGYRESWNIVSERSKADDVGFLEAIVLKLASRKNVDSNNFTIMGSSNGAALVNQLAIESKLPNIRNYISGVSQLNVWQHDGEHFKAKGDDNNYRKIATPQGGRRLLNISGVKDKLVPYFGGPSQVIPAKGDKLAFVPAEESTFLWAKEMGHAGNQLSQPSKIIENVEIFSYLDGDVVHCKVNNEGHGATHGISEQLLLDFLDAKENNPQ
ncbi:MAG: hypothetical protein P8N76_17785 [Pirellulaceae bacterium]|nr:hypothetical protein [Pirellulaceae bacterium]